MNAKKKAASLVSEYFIFLIFAVLVIGLAILKPSFIGPKIWLIS